MHPDPDPDAGRKPRPDTQPGLSPGLRPRLRPGTTLLRRSEDELQIGLDPGWRLPDPAGRWQQALGRLDGLRTWRQLAAEMRDQDRAALARLLTSLAAAGLADLRPPAASRVRLVGGGVLGRALADRLLANGINVSSGTRSASTTRLSVVAAEKLEGDRVVAAGLLRHDVPHLLVRADSAGAVVGPLVVPGRTACLHCTDLIRRDADPAWPRLLNQLEHLPAEPSPAVLDWAVATVVTQVLGFLAGERPETYGATLEVAAPAYAMRRRCWSPHPECSCHWAGMGSG